jgi:ribosomal protein S1
MNMNRTIGNEELAYLFEDTSFITRNGKKVKNEKKSPEYLALEKLYGDFDVQVPEKGVVTSSTYVGKKGDQYLFEASGYKDYVRVDDKLNEVKYLKNIEVGDIVDVIITEVNDKNYIIKGSIATLYESRAHANLKAISEGESVTVLVKALNPAGYEVEIYNGGVTLPGFMPNTLAGINKLVDPTSIVGITFEVMIESFSEQEGTYIVSRRKYLHSLIPAAIKELNQENVYNGHVTGTAPFGVFVEFNECLTGMIHKANVHPEWQDKLGDIKPGFEIEFYVKEIVKDKIILTQILRETLWDNIKNGQVLDGVVKDTKQFGTLINLDAETVGLIHTSEMDKLGKKFIPGQELKVKVLSVDRMSRKIFLTIG